MVATRTIATALLVILAAAPAARSDDGATLAVKAARLHVGNGTVIENAVLVIEGGRITAVGADVAIPDGATVLDAGSGSLTPGLIDAGAWVEPESLIRSTRESLAAVEQEKARAFFRRVAVAAHGEDDSHETAPRGLNDGSDALLHAHVDDDVDCPVCGDADPGRPGGFAPGVSTRLTSEQASETVPHTRVLDAIDLASPDFDRLARGGVTTVYASPDATAVIGPRGAILRTAGPLEARVLRAEDAVKAVMGSDPSSSGGYNRPPYGNNVTMYTRRPTTRMGVTWVFRKAFYDTLLRQQGLEPRGADTPPVAASRVLERVLDGTVPLRVQARTEQDINSAVRLCAEFGVPFVLEEATEAYRCIDLIKLAAAPVVLGPIQERPSGLSGYTVETQQARLYTLRTLIEAGVETALSAKDLREEDGLARQAMYAIRFGVSPEDALRAVTSTPARLLGLDGELGTLESGKRADLIVWSGAPFAATSMPLVVVLDGKVVVDRRSS